MTSSTTRLGLSPFEKLARLVAIRRLQRVIARSLEITDDDLAHYRLVVDNEDRCHDVIQSLAR